MLERGGLKRGSLLDRDLFDAYQIYPMLAFRQFHRSAEADAFRKTSKVVRQELRPP